MQGTRTMSFAQLLYGIPTERLRRILRNRAHTIRGLARAADKRELAASLASALSNQESVERALDDTNLLEARVLVAVVARGGDMPLEELRALAAAQSDMLKGAL